jgi:hypothetical protein
MMATHELVVPKSMPMILPMCMLRNLPGGPSAANGCQMGFC